MRKIPSTIAAVLLAGTVVLPVSTAASASAAPTAPAAPCPAIPAPPTPAGVAVGEVVNSIVPC
jgi:hypothetical protein